MNKAFAGLGIGCLALIILAVIFGVVMFQTIGKESASSKAYVDTVIPAIITNWSKEEFLKQASPELTKEMTGPDATLDKLLAKMAQMGPLRSYDGATCTAINVNYTTEGKKAVASYTAKATFDKGKVTIQLDLREIDGAWKIEGIEVESPFFLQ